jgi:Tfp pilus assembly protein FimT
MDIAVMPYALERELNMTKNAVPLERSFRPSSAGFTVVELVVLVAVIAILSAIGFPLYLSYSRAQETDSAARVIVVALNQARQLAVTRGVSFSAETQTNPNNRMRFCSGTVVPCPSGNVFTGAETDTNGWRTLENGSRITLGPTITFSSLGAATAAGRLRVQNSSATGSLDVCVSPSGRIRVLAVGAACP